MPQPSFYDHRFADSVSKRIAELVRASCGDAAAPTLVVGLSGGPDSVALLLAAKVWSAQTGFRVTAAHFNHRLRPDQAEPDAQFCGELCTALEISFHQDGEDPRPLARSRGQGLEEAARHLRHQFFGKVLANIPGPACVATGHHRDDQTETVIMRLFRGTGPAGLRGILPVSGRIIHPLLTVGRNEIVAFLEDCGQPWRTDSTNLDGDNTRARIRRELLPVARGIFGPGSDAVPARLAELLQRDMEILERFTREALEETRIPDKPDQLSVAKLLDLRPGLDARALKRWLEEMQPEGLERVHVDAVLTWLREGQSGGGLDLPGGLRLVRDFDRLSRRTHALAGGALRKAEDYRILVTKNPGDSPGDHQPGCGDPADESTWRVTCPADCLNGNLKVRNWHRGDRFQPFGLDGTKKLSDLLRERQIPRDKRAEVLVVADEAGIVWVVGVARAERTRLLPSTARTVTISVAKRSEDPNGLSETRNDT